MAIDALLKIGHVRCLVSGHNWAMHLYQAENPADVMICLRCGAERAIIRSDATRAGERLRSRHRPEPS